MAIQTATLELGFRWPIGIGTLPAERNIAWKVINGSPTSPGSTVASGNFNISTPSSEYQLLSFPCVATFTDTQTYSIILTPTDVTWSSSGGDTDEIGWGMEFGPSTWKQLTFTTSYFDNSDVYDTWNDYAPFKYTNYFRFKDSDGTVVLGFDFEEPYPSHQRMVRWLESTGLLPVAAHRRAVEFVIAEDPLPEKAITPSYPHGFTSAPNGTPATLTWVDGGEGEANAASAYDIYFGTSFGGPTTLVAEDIPAGSESWDVPKNIQQLIGNMPSTYFEALTTYEWYVVSKNDVGGETTGDTWEFTTNSIRTRSGGGLGGAHTPTPVTEATGQSVTITGMSWLGCEGSSTNTVYMGQVSGQLEKQFTVSGSQLNVNPSSYRFAYGQTTYWRVDTAREGQSVTGTEWQLTFLTLGNGDGTGIIVTPAGPWGAGGSPTKRLATMLTNKGIWYEDLL